MPQETLICMIGRYCNKYLCEYVVRTQVKKKTAYAQRFCFPEST